MVQFQHVHQFQNNLNIILTQFCVRSVEVLRISKLMNIYNSFTRSMIYLGTEIRTMTCSMLELFVQTIYLQLVVSRKAKIYD